MTIPEPLRQVADALQAGKTPERVSVRTLLSWFHAARRGLWIVREIRSALRLLGIRTSPDFDQVWIGASVAFEIATPAEFKACCAPEDDSREIRTVADLTFGEYIRLLENPERWEKLKTGIDRGAFLAQLHRVREIRNDVMHFDPDPFPDADLILLRKFVRFFQALRAQGAV